MYVFILKRDRNTGDYSAATYPGDGAGIPGITSENVSSVSGKVITLSSGIDIWPGDPLLDSLGGIHRVTAVNATGTEITVNGTPTITGGDKVWYAPPADRGNSSPAIDLFVVTINTHLMP